MARFGSFGGGLSAGLSAGLDRQSADMDRQYKGLLQRYQMSQAGLEKFGNILIKYKENGQEPPPELVQLVKTLAKQADEFGVKLGQPEAGVNTHTMEALLGAPGPAKELKPITVQNQDNFDTKTFWSQKEAKDFLDSVRSKEFVRDESGVIQDTGAGNWIIVDTPTARSLPEPTDSRTTKRQDFEYWQKMPEGPEKDAFAKGANFNLTEDKGTELQQNLDHFNSLPEGEEKEVWRKKLGVGDDDPAKIELFKAYQNLPAEQQAAYDTFYKSDAKDSRTALMKNFDFLNSISDPEQKATFTALLQPDPSAPSIVREWAIVSSWSPEKQAQYLEYRKQIATMNMQQKMGIAEMIVAQAMGQNNTGAGNSFLNQVVTQPDAANPQTGPVVIKNDAEYEALPSGTVFIGPDGVERTKP